MIQWLEPLTGVTVVVGPIPTWNSEIISVVPFPVAKQPSFTCCILIVSVMKINGATQTKSRTDKHHEVELGQSRYCKKTFKNTCISNFRIKGTWEVVLLTKS